MESRKSSLIGLGCLFLASLSTATDFVLISGDTDTLYQFPGPAANGTLNDGADIQGSEPTTIIGSDPNYLGAWSYIAGEQPFGIPDTVLPQSPGGVEANLIAFGGGVVTVDDTVLMSGGGPLITDWNLQGTAYGQGLGTSTIAISNVNSGGYTTATGNLSLDLDLTTTFFNGILSVPISGLALSGTSVVQNSLAVTGNSYIDNVVIPKATALGATGIMFIDLTGTIPANLPFVPVAVEVRILLVGVSGIAPAAQADVSVSKSVAPAVIQSPGNQVVYTLTANNAGPANATGVTVTDNLPPEIIWVSDTCGSGGPGPNGLLSWSAGSINSGNFASCAVTLDISANANFDFRNAAVAFADQHDTDLSNNIAEQTTMLLDGGDEGIAQSFSPAASSVSPADLTCSACAGGLQTLADNFKVNNSAQFEQLVFFGGYTDNAPVADNFTVLVYSDSALTPGVPGVPGQLVANISAPATRGNSIGVQAGAFSVFEYRMPINLNLPRGSYWLVVANNIGATGKDWFWAAGVPDVAGRSVETAVFGTNMPDDNQRWGPSPSLSFSFSLLATPAGGGGSSPIPVPFLGGFGLILLSGLLGFIVWTRRS